MSFEGRIVERSEGRVILCDGSFSFLSPKNYLDLRDNSAKFAQFNKGDLVKVDVFVVDYAEKYEVGETVENDSLTVVQGRLHEMDGGRILLKDQPKNLSFVEQFFGAWKTILVNDTELESAENKMLDLGDYIIIEVRK